MKGVCQESDVVIVCLGLDAGLEGEEGDTGNQFASGDKPDLQIPGHAGEGAANGCGERQAGNLACSRWKCDGSQLG